MKVAVWEPVGDMCASEKLKSPPAAPTPLTPLPSKQQPECEAKCLAHRPATATLLPLLFKGWRECQSPGMWTTPKQKSNLMQFLLSWLLELLFSAQTDLGRARVMKVQRAQITHRWDFRTRWRLCVSIGVSYMEIASETFQEQQLFLVWLFLKRLVFACWGT